MSTSVPTANDTSPARRDAVYAARDALTQILGEIQGSLEHDPDAVSQLCRAVAAIVQDEPSAVDAPVVVADIPNGRRISVTAEHRKAAGHSVGIVWLNEDLGDDPDAEDLNAAYRPSHGSRGRSSRVEGKKPVGRTMGPDPPHRSR